jgi:sorting nexin-1/2
VARWPGCFIPPLPIKKVIGNSDVSFVEERRRGLEIFMNSMSRLKHLWYSKEFQTFLRGSGDVEKVSHS